MDGGGNVLWIKGSHSSKKTRPCHMGLQRKTALVPGGPGFRPLLVLRGLLTSSTARMSPGCFGTSWEVEAITDQADMC